MIIVGRRPAGRLAKATTWFAFLSFTLIYLQKFGLNFGGASASILQPAFCLGVIGLAATGTLKVSIPRFLLLIGLITAMLLGQGTGNGSVSMPSLLLLIITYVPLIFVCNLGREAWLQTLRTFQNMMLVPAGMVFVDIVAQAVGLHPPSMADMVPKEVLIQGYLYEGHLHYGDPWIRPNGFFMLEPSFFSAFAACSVIIEVAVFRRFWRMFGLVAAMFACTAATGLLLLALASPLLLARERLTVQATVITGCLIVSALLIASGGLDFLFGRVGELDTPGTSGHERLLGPAIHFTDLLQDPANLIFGAGPGTYRVAFPVSPGWPFAKIGFEYGVLSAAFFMAFTLVGFVRSPLPACAFGLYIIYNFTGGYLNSPLPTLLFILITTIRVSDAGAQAEAPRRLTVMQPRVGPPVPLLGAQFGRPPIPSHGKD